MTPLGGITYTFFSVAAAQQGSLLNQSLKIITHSNIDLMEYENYQDNPLVKINANKENSLFAFFPDNNYSSENDNWLFRINETGELYPNDYFTFSDPNYPWMGYDWNEDGIQNNIFNLYISASLGEEQVIKHFIVEIKQKYSVAIKINESSDAIFEQAHGTCQKGNIMYIGTRSGKIVSFNDASDLTDYNVITLPGTNDIEAMIYDSINNRIYATCCYNYVNVKILSINPNDISDYSTVFDFGSTLLGNSQSIESDGIHIYVSVTSQDGNISYLHKIRLSDFLIVNSITFSNIINLHAMKLYKYNDRTELYLTNAANGIDESYFIKLNCNTMTYELLQFIGIFKFTDDFALKYNNNNGSTIYLGCEAATLMCIVDTENMTYTTHPANFSYGMFFANGDLYNLSFNGNFGLQSSITKYPLLNLGNEITKVVEKYDAPNELFYSDSKLFYTSWGTNKLVQFEI